MRQSVLFLCTGNSCRSQMAEGLLRHYGAGRYEAFSAGTAPVGVNPGAVQVMEELGADISGQRSKHVEEFQDREFDMVVTVCDHAREACPVIPGARRILHWNIDDPAGRDLGAFRSARDAIAAHIRELL
jgi:arsenate reductase (thioredoxin)